VAWRLLVKLNNAHKAVWVILCRFFITGIFQILRFEYLCVTIKLGKYPAEVKMEFTHKSVLLTEAVEALNIRPNGVYIDATLGGGGHTLEIAKQLQNGFVVGIDKDDFAITQAKKVLAPHMDKLRVARCGFDEIEYILQQAQIAHADGVLMDLGVSSFQLDDAERGFSYKQDAPLDMRMSGRGTSAAQLLAEASAAELAGIFSRYGEEKFSLRIARNIVAQRESEPITTTAELVDIIRDSIPAAARREGGHPAKRVFQALRIAVNGELDSLRTCLDAAFDRLNPGGRLAIITFRSLDDRMVKQAFAGYATGCRCPSDFPVCVCGRSPRAKLIGRKPQTASPQELAENPRAKSAKLRTLEKI